MPPGAQPDHWLQRVTLTRGFRVLKAGCADIDPCRTPCICERLSTPSDKWYAHIMIRRSTTLKTDVAVVCWSWVRRGYTNAKWRFPIRDFAFIMPIRGSVDPAYRWLSRSQQTTATSVTYDDRNILLRPTGAACVHEVVESRLFMASKTTNQCAIHSQHIDD